MKWSHFITVKSFVYNFKYFVNIGQALLFFVQYILIPNTNKSNKIYFSYEKSLSNYNDDYEHIFLKNIPVLYVGR